MSAQPFGDSACEAASPYAAAVTLYDEADLITVNAPHQGTQSALVRQLLATGSARQRERIVRMCLDEIGFEWMGYYAVRQLPGGGLQRTYLATYSRYDWVKRYFDQHYDDVDPCHKRACESVLPLVWDADFVEETIGSGPTSTRARRFVKDLQESGMNSGISFPVTSPGGQQGDRTVISFVSSIANRRWMGDRVQGDALMFGLRLHDFMVQHVRLPEKGAAGDDRTCGATANGLPAMQQAVLGHVARGLTDRQIAERLSVSSHAVDYHLRQLRQRFAVRNRMQLVNAAAALMGAC